MALPVIRWCLLLVLCIPILTAQAQIPTTNPAAGVKQIVLEDPRRPDALCYLDLDTGRTFAYRESIPENFAASRRWITEQSVDLMCETNAPANGFAVYQTALIPARGSFDSINDYALGVEQLKTADEPSPFNLMPIGASLPKTYLFRTSQGAIGVLEVTELTAQPSGMRLREKILTKPIRPDLPLGRGPIGRGRRGGPPTTGFIIPLPQPAPAGQGPNTFPVLGGGRRGDGVPNAGAAIPMPGSQSGLGRQIESDQLRLLQLQSLYVQELTNALGAGHVAVIDARRRLELMAQLSARPSYPETDALRLLLQRRLDLQQKIAGAELSLEQQNIAVSKLHKELDNLQAEIDLRAAGGSTTQPSALPIKSQIDP